MSKSHEDDIIINEAEAENKDALENFDNHCVEPFNFTSETLYTEDCLSTL